MKSLFSAKGWAEDRLPEAEYLRFRRFAYAKMRTGLKVLMFSMPFLFAIGWARDVAVLGEAAQWTLLLRLALVLGLLALATLTWLSGFSRAAEVFGSFYALLFGTAIALTTAIEPIRLSLTHVPLMLMAVIFLPYSISRWAAAATAAGLVMPLLVLLWYLESPAALWAAYLLFFGMGCAIGLVQRRAQLKASLDVFLHRQRLLHRLHRDTLTDTINREGWETRAHRLHRIQRDMREPLSVIHFDLDHFKAVNEQVGKTHGDAILAAASDAMKAHLRHGDLLARIGGKSFVILLPGSNAAAAMRVAERIRAAISGLRMGPAVSASAGVTQTRSNEPLKSATRRAEAAMREAKERGRDRVVLA